MKNNKVKEVKLKEYENANEIVRRTYGKSGLSEKEFAEKAGISINSLKSYLYQGTEPRPETMHKIEKAFGGQVTMNFNE